jgi:hypothetical protein
MSAAMSVHNLPGSKLLNYVTKDQLKEFLSPIKYAEVEQTLRKQLNKERMRINLKEIKQYLSTRDDFLGALRGSQIGVRAFGKYKVASERLQNMEIRDRSQKTRQIMQQPRQRYKGCLASKIPFFFHKLLLELRYETLLQGNIIQHYLVLSMMTYINISYTYRVSMTDNIVTDNQPHWLCCDWCDG